MTGGAEVTLRRWEAPGVVEPRFCLMCAEMTRVGGGGWTRTEELTRQCGQRGRHAGFAWQWFLHGGGVCDLKWCLRTESGRRLLAWATVWRDTGRTWEVWADTGDVSMNMVSLGCLVHINVVTKGVRCRVRTAVQGRSGAPSPYTVNKCFLTVSPLSSGTSNTQENPQQGKYEWKDKLMVSYRQTFRFQLCIKNLFYRK